jgi:hypothetical protein
VLLVGVSAQATAIAYIYRPRLKALLYSVPLPFTLATMALGQGVESTNVCGLVLLLGYAHGIRFLHRCLGVHIVASIALCALAYAGAATALVPWLPQTSGAFWAGCGAAMALGLALFLLLPDRPEPGHRTPLPVWIMFCSEPQ